MNSFFEFSTTAAYRVETALKTRFELIMSQTTKNRLQSSNQFYFFRVKAVKERICFRSNELKSFVLGDIKAIRALNVRIKHFPFFDS